MGNMSWEICHGKYVMGNMSESPKKKERHKKRRDFLAQDSYIMGNISCEICHVKYVRRLKENLKS
jgi:hypothetical protein